MASFADSNVPVLFLGTGIMGAPMARNIAAKGIEVIAWNRDSSKVRPLMGHGIRPVTIITDISIAQRIVIIMVSTGDVVEDLLFQHGTDAPLGGRLAQGSVVVVMSSIPVETAIAQAERLASMGIGYIDAPVSGGESGAIAGTLTIMAGGSATDIRRCQPILETMGHLHHVGPVGTGQLAKLANQTIVGITIGAVAEALLLAKAGGADLAKVRQALMGGFASSEILRQHGERMIKEDFVPGARAHVQLKDLTTALNLAAAEEIETPLLERTRQLYAAMCERDDLRELDHSAVYLYLDQK